MVNLVNDPNHREEAIDLIFGIIIETAIQKPALTKPDQKEPERESEHVNESVHESHSHLEDEQCSIQDRFMILDAPKSLQNLSKSSMPNPFKFVQKQLKLQKSPRALEMSPPRSGRSPSTPKRRRNDEKGKA